MNLFINDVSDVRGYGDVPKDPVCITAGGYEFSGWETVEVSVGVEVMPWVARFEGSDWNPQGDVEPVLKPGAECVITIGSTKVITGWIIFVERQMTSGRKTVSVGVASKSVDLVECAAEFFSFQLNSTSVSAVIEKVCAPFGIKVFREKSYVEATPLTQFAVIMTETGYEIIERLTRLAGCLFYDRPDGNIALASAGDHRAASGFVQGENVEAFSVLNSLADRYGSVRAILNTEAVLFNPPPDDASRIVEEMNLITGEGCVAFDHEVKRHRPLFIPVETGDANQTVAKRRVQWEVNRRMGRGQVIRLTCDSWRDKAGNLWSPNTIAPVSLPGGKSDYSGDFLITEVTFRRGEDGTHADITLMPAVAMSPEPIVPPGQDNPGYVAITEGASK